MPISRDILAALSVRMTTDASQFNKGIQSSTKGMQNMAAIGKKLGTALAGIFSIASVYAIGRMAKEAAEFADKIDKTAIRTGLARENLQELAFVADQAGVSYETIEQAITRLTRAMGDAENGSVRQERAFKRLGIQIRDAEGNMRHMTEIFPEVIRKLNGIHNETERNALAMEFFGRGALNLVPLLAQLGDEGIKELSEKAHELNLIISDEGIASLVEYKDKMSQLKMQFQTMSRVVMVEFADVMTQNVIPALQDATKAVSNFGEIRKAITNEIKEGDGYMKKGFDFIKDLFPAYWFAQYGKKAIDFLGEKAKKT